MKKNTFFTALTIALSLMACNTEEASVGSQLENQSLEPVSTNLAARPSVVSTWKLVPSLSNEFNYASKASNQFTDNWQDSFFNGWTGPGLTKYTPAQATIENNMLVFRANIVNGKVQTGCVSSKGTTSYPMYMEARVKVSNSDLSTAVWMLSEDSSEELDNLETWGNVDNSYFSIRDHLSHHCFKTIDGVRKDYQPTGNATYYSSTPAVKWSEDFHVYGVLWTGPKVIKYYIDDVLVRTTPQNEIDPLNYTDKGGLTKPMYMIISQAAQPWRETLGSITPYLTNPTVTNTARTETKIDWIRVYKP